MTPTNELRFVERMVQVNESGKFIAGYVPLVRPVRVLQQKWQEISADATRAFDIEWRDVPLVKEEA